MKNRSDVEVSLDFLLTRLSRSFCRSSETLLGVPSDRTTQFSDTLLSPQRHQRLHNDYLGTNNTYQAHVTVAAPIFDSFDKATRKHVGDLLGIFAMESFLINLLPEGVRGVYVVVENTCGKIFTFRLDGNRVSALDALWTGGTFLRPIICSVSSFARHAGVLFGRRRV